MIKRKKQVLMLMVLVLFLAFTAVAMAAGLLPPTTTGPTHAGF